MTTKQRLTNVYRNRNPDGCWFDPKTIRYFNTRFGRMTRIGKVYVFITSEQLRKGKRVYSVRRMDNNGRVETLSLSCEMDRGGAARAFDRAVLSERDIGAATEES